MDNYESTYKLSKCSKNFHNYDKYDLYSIPLVLYEFIKVSYN